MAETLSTETISEKKETPQPKEPKGKLPHWCMHCIYYKVSKKARPLMECYKRGGTRMPNDGESCIYFRRKK